MPFMRDAWYLLELRPVVLPTDVAAVRARHILENLIAQEAIFHAA